MQELRGSNYVDSHGKRENDAGGFENGKVLSGSERGKALCNERWPHDEGDTCAGCG